MADVMFMIAQGGAGAGGGRDAGGAAGRAVQAAGSVEELVRAIQALPWGVHLVVLGAMIGGVVLWLLGRQVVKPATALVLAAFGAGVGFIMLPSLGQGSGGGMSPYLGLIAGVVIGLIAGFVLERFTTAATFGGVLGAGCMLLTAAGIGMFGEGVRGPTAGVVAMGPGGVEGLPPMVALADGGSGLGGEEQPLRVPEAERPTTPSAPRRMTPAAPGGAGAAKPATPGRSGGEARTQQGGSAGGGGAGKPAAGAAGAKAGKSAGAPAGSASAALDKLDPDSTAAKARDLYRAASGQVQTAWDATPQPQRMWMIGSGVIGCGLGVLAGLALPGWAAAAVTSLVGAAVWLPAAAWLAHAFYLPGRENVTLAPVGWAVVWVVVAVIGMAVQTQGLMPGGGGGGGKKGKRAKGEE